MRRFVTAACAAPWLVLVGCSALLDLDGDFARDAGAGDTGVDAGTDTGTTDTGTDAGEPLCTPPMPPAVSGCGSGGATFLFAISRIAIAVTDGSSGHTPGFNIDGCNTPADGPTGCGHMDGTFDIDGNGVIEGLENGIDNQFAALGTTGTMFFDMQQLVRDGQLLWLVELSGVNSIDDDDCVDVAILRGVVPGGGLPATAPDGTLAGGQTFDIDDRSYDSGGQALAFARGRIDDGRLRIGPFTMPMAVHLEQGLWAPDLFDAQLLVDGATGTFEGVLGGGWAVESLVEVVAASSWVDRSSARGLLEAIADLVPDETNEHCAQVSAGFVVNTVSVVQGSVVDARSCERDWPLAWWVDAGGDCKACMCASCDWAVLECLDTAGCRELIACNLQHGCTDLTCSAEYCSSSEYEWTLQAYDVFSCMQNNACECVEW
jgi:hypothetical protein